MNTNRKPFTREQIDFLIPKIDQKLTEYEQEFEGVKPLPPLSVAECKDYFGRLMDLAHERPLTRNECFMHGQLLSQFGQAVLGEKLGIGERCYVVTESDMAKVRAELGIKNGKDSQ